MSRDHRIGVFALILVLVAVTLLLVGLDTFEQGSELHLATPENGPNPNAAPTLLLAAVADATKPSRLKDLNAAYRLVQSFALHRRRSEWKSPTDFLLLVVADSTSDDALKVFQDLSDGNSWLRVRLIEPTSLDATFENKLRAWSEPETDQYDWTAVLDCDMLFVGPFWDTFIETILSDFPDTTASCRPAGHALELENFVAHQNMSPKWRPEDVPDSLLASHLGGDTIQPLYCNGGMVLLNRQILPAVRRIWLGYSDQFDQREFSPQMALSLALLRLALVPDADSSRVPVFWKEAPLRFNCPTSKVDHEQLCDKAQLVHTVMDSLDLDKMQFINHPNQYADVLEASPRKRASCPRLFRDTIDKLRSDVRNAPVFEVAINKCVRPSQRQQCASLQVYERDRRRAE